MKKIYEQPMVDLVEMKERYGIMTMDSEGETGDPMAKENNFTFDSDDPYELWGDDSSDEDWLNDNNN